MHYYLVTISVTAILIVLISETAKRSSLIGAILASVPMISALAIFWLYVDTGDVARVSALASNIFWLVIRSLAFFVTLPMLLKKGVSFYLSMSLSLVVTITCYWCTVYC